MFKILILGVEGAETSSSTLLSFGQRIHNFKFLYCFFNLFKIVCIVDKGATEHPPQVFEYSYSKLTILVHSICGSTERALECEAVNQVKLFPHHHPRSSFSRLLDCKVAIIEAEMLRVLVEQQREYSLLESIGLRTRTPIHE